VSPPRSQARLYAVAAVFALIVAVLLAVAHEQAQALSQVRAYTTGEGLYSKAQKNAVIGLLRYARSASASDYERFLREIQVPLGDRDARLALLRPEPDLGAAREGFLRGRNHPEDVEGLATFFVRFRGVSYVAEAIRIWTEGDAEVAQLVSLGEALHRAIAARAPEADIEALLDRIVAVDARLTLLEDRFSTTLGEGARFLVRTSELLLLAMAAAMLALGLVFSMRVVRQARRAEAALLKSEARYRALSESMIDGVLILQKGRFVHANPAALRLLGYRLEELRGREFAPLVHPDFRAMVAERHRRRLAGETFASRYDIQVLTRAGEPVWVQIGNARIDEWEGEPAVLTIISDVSERKRAESEIRSLNESLEARVRARTAELESALDEMESFSYSISHDLRAPLRAVNGYAQILLREHAAELGAEARRLLERTSASALSMAQLVDGLLEFARLGRRALDVGELDMAALARGAAEELRAGAGIVTIGELPPARGDAPLVRQVWLNLLSNALKFSAMRSEPRIRVSGRNAGGETVYRVRDNGVGFDMAYASKLFGVFQRLHGVEEFPGTGIGLALVRRIVERHGGRVWAEGNPGEGATFGFALPAAR
jgi:PAS domain S-box-containing protein